MAQAAEDMQDQTKPGLKEVSDTKKLREAIFKSFHSMDEIEKERNAANAKADEIRASLENQGIPRKAFNAAYQRWKMDAEKRQAHDVAFSLCCNAGGVQFQSDLFEPLP